MYPAIEVPILEAIKAAAEKLGTSKDQSITSVERGVVLYESAKQAMLITQQKRIPPFFHNAIKNNFLQEIEVTDYNKLDDYPCED